MKKAKHFFYGLTRNSQNPLDPRLKINSLTTIDTELELVYRYNGLIFHVKDIDKIFVFLNDLLNPVDLSNYISGNIIFGITNNGVYGVYTTLLTDLNSTNPTLGSLVTVYPLGVTFIYNGVVWEYFSGVYKVDDETIFDSIPNELRELNKEILIGSDYYMFDTTLNKSTPIINVIEKPVNPINNRFYNLNGIFYYSFGGSWIKLGDKNVIQTINLVVGDNEITHDLNTYFVSANLVFDNVLTGKKEIVELTLTNVSENIINIKSKFNISGTIMIVGKN